MDAARWAAALKRMDAPGPHRDWLAKFQIKESAWRGLCGFEGQHPDGPDRKRPALLYAELDRAGKVLGSYDARYIGGGGVKTKLRGHAFLLGAHLLPESKATVFVCSGDKDFLVARSLGFHAVGLLGEGTLPDGAVTALRQHDIVFALDADEAGRRATEKHLATFRAAGVEARAIRWPAAWIVDGRPPTFC